MAEQIEIIEALEEVFRSIMKSYEPAASGSATVRMTTQQIYGKVFSFYPSEAFLPVHIYTLMKRAEFSYEVSGSEMDFYWLLKEK